jgi:hypothetical protein
VGSSGSVIACRASFPNPRAEPRPLACPLAHSPQDIDEAFDEIELEATGCINAGQPHPPHHHHHSRSRPYNLAFLDPKQGRPLARSLAQDIHEAFDEIDLATD